MEYFVRGQSFISASKLDWRMYLHWCLFETSGNGAGHLIKLIVNGDSGQYQRVGAQDDIETVLTTINTHLIERAWDK
jgi:hypothetical protein